MTGSGSTRKLSGTIRERAVVRVIGSRGGWLLLPIAGSVRRAECVEAIPVFASQTGQAGTACHGGGFGPQLTPPDRAGKISGYAPTDGEGRAASVPLSLTATTPFTITSDRGPGDPPATTTTTTTRSCCSRG